MRRIRQAVLAAIMLGALFVIAMPVGGQEWLGFRGSLGHESVHGDLGKALDGDTRTEWSILVATDFMKRHHFRVGAGFSRVTYDLEPEFRTQSGRPSEAKRWNHVGLHVLASAHLLSAATVRPFVEGRFIAQRFRSQTELLHEINSEDPIRERPYEEWPGKGFEALVGVESDMGSMPFSLHAGFRISQFGPSTLDLTDYGLGPRDGAWSWGVQAGLIWTLSG